MAVHLDRGSLATKVRAYLENAINAYFTKIKERKLRPDYQIPRFGKDLDRQAAKEAGAQVAAELALPATEQKGAFPSGAVEQTAAVFATLASASGPVDAATIANQFRKTRTTERKVAEVLASLAPLGHVTSDGQTFALRKIA